LGSGVSNLFPLFTPPVSTCRGGNLPHITQRRRAEEVTDVEKCADSSLYPSVEHHPREEILRGGHWPQAQGRVGGRCSLRMRRCGRFHVSDTQRVLPPASEFTVGLAYWFYDAESHGTPAAGRNKPIASRKDPSMEGGPSPPNWAHSGFSGPRLTPMRRKVVMLAHSMNLSPRKRRKMRQHEMPYARTTPSVGLHLWPKSLPLPTASEVWRIVDSAWYCGKLESWRLVPTSVVTP
jgi:hypothetical protein